MFDEGAGADEFHVVFEGCEGEGDSVMASACGGFGVEVALDAVVDEGNEACGDNDAVFIRQA